MSAAATGIVHARRFAEGFMPRLFDVDDGMSALSSICGESRFSIIDGVVQTQPLVANVDAFEEVQPALRAMIELHRRIHLASNFGGTASGHTSRTADPWTTAASVLAGLLVRDVEFPAASLATKKVLFPVTSLSRRALQLLPATSQRRFSEFTQYLDGWDDGRGSALSPYSIAAFNDFVSYLSDEPLVGSLFLHRNGNLAFRPRGDAPRRYEIAFAADGLNLLVAGDGSVCVGWGQLTASIADDLARGRWDGRRL